MRGIIIVIIVAALCVSCGTVALGLPGAIIFAINSPLIQIIFGPTALEQLPPDSMWPIAIVITLLWPIGLIIGYLVAYHGLSPASRSGRIGLWAGVILGWNAILTFGCYYLGRTG